MGALAASVAWAVTHDEKKSPPSLSQAGGFLVEVQFGKGERGSYPPTLTLRSRLKCHRSTTAPFYHAGIGLQQTGKLYPSL